MGWGAMDLVNGVLNWVGTPAMVASLLLFYPPYYLFKTCYSFLSWLFPEDVAGKVVLITGASSGIGEVRTVRSPLASHPFAERSCCYLQLLICETCVCSTWLTSTPRGGPTWRWWRGGR